MTTELELFGAPESPANKLCDSRPANMPRRAMAAVSGAQAALDAAADLIQQECDPTEYDEVIDQLRRVLIPKAVQTPKPEHDQYGSASLIRCCAHGKFPFGACPKCYAHKR